MLSRVSIVFLLFFVIQSSPVLAQNPVHFLGDTCMEYRDASTEMMQVYREVKQLYASDTLFTTALTQSQASWQLFRQAQTTAMYPLAKDKTNDLLSACECLENLKLTLDRIRQLRRWIDGEPTNKVCLGSIKLNPGQ